MSKYFLLFCGICALLLVNPVVAEQQTPLDRAYLKAYPVKAAYEEVLEFVKLGIGDRGMKINNISHIGKMLQRTAEAVGAKKEIYKHAKALEFCSAVVSRLMMEADPHHIVFCPYIIFVYELKQEPGIVYVSYRKPDVSVAGEKSAALGKVQKLLEEIIAEAIE